MHVFAAALAMLAWSGPPPDAEVSPNRVALVRGGGDEPLETRLGAELRAAGYDVVEVAPFETQSASALDDALAATGAGVAMRVAVTPALIRVSVRNRVSGKPIDRSVAPEDSQRIDRALVALWAVELLRASALAPIAAARASPAPPLPPLATMPVGASLEVAPALAMSPGGFGAAWHLALAARWQRAPHHGLEAVLLAPLVPTRLVRADGAAVISMGLLGVGAFVATGPVSARVSAQAGAGVALIVVRATGEATDAFASRSDHAVSAGPFARAGAALRVAEWLRLRADALVGVTFPRPVVAFGDTTVASWGRPWVATLVGAEVTF